MALGPEFDRWIWENLEPEWRAKAAAGSYDEDMPSLRRLCIAVTAQQEQDTAYWVVLCGMKIVADNLMQEPVQAPLVFN